MSAREWKPGDVLLVRGEIALATNDEGGTAIYIETASGKCLLVSDVGDDARPLVVIDPEDREQVKRLHALWCKAIVSKGTSARQIDSMQAALRHFANPKPPKPEEPTGLGAVVEDSEGKEWVRIARGRWGWVPANAILQIATKAQDETPGFLYADIDAVRVLSEGVTQ